MASRFFRRFTALRSLPQSNASNNVSSRSYSKIYEPDYLETLKPKYPVYPPLTVQIKSYNFPILESYQSWIHKVADTMDFDIENCYVMPAREIKVTRYKPKSTVPETNYLLKMYERNITLCNVPAVRLPIFLRIIEAALPEGVTLNIEEWNAEKENHRFIPDKQLLDMKEQLDDMTNSKEKK